MEGEYSVKGYWLLDGSRGFQSGEIRLHMDGKLTGKITDEDARRKTEKIVLGVHSNECRDIDFLKIASGLRRGTDSMPVIWHLERTLVAARGFAYEGHFAF